MVKVRANEAERTWIVENRHPFRLIRPDTNGAARDQLGELMVQVRANGAVPVQLGKRMVQVRANEAERTRIVENRHNSRLIRPYPVVENLERMRLQQTQLPGTRHGLGAALHL